MEPQQLFRELMKDENLHTRLNITKEEAEQADYMVTSDNKNIEVIKDVIQGVVNNKRLNTVFRGIQNLLS